MEPITPTSTLTDYQRGVRRVLLLTLVLTGFAVFPRLARPGQRALLGYGILVALGLDIFTHVPRQNPTISRPLSATARVGVEITVCERMRP